MQRKNEAKAIETTMLPETLEQRKAEAEDFVQIYQKLSADSKKRYLYMMQGELFAEEVRKNALGA